MAMTDPMPGAEKAPLLFPLHGRPVPAVLSGGAVACLGLVVVMGWHARDPRLIQVLSGAAPMVYNTALGLVCSGASLMALALDRRRGAALAAVAALFLGLLTLAEYLGVDLGIDELFMVDNLGERVGNPGRMGPNTALGLVAGGLGLGLLALFPQARRGLAGAGLLGALLVLTGALALLGYVLGVETAYGWGRSTRMAVHTGAGFLVLGGGLLAEACRAGAALGANTRLETPSAARRRVLALFIAIISATTLLMLVTDLRNRYQFAVDETREDLEAMAAGWGHLIQRVASLDPLLRDHPVPEAAARHLAGHLLQGDTRVGGFGATGDLLLGWRAGDAIRQLSVTGKGPLTVWSLPRGTPWAEVMGHAIEGRTGTLTGTDRQGREVLAAFQPIPAVDLGLVAKVDLAELRSPVLRAGILDTGIALLAILLGGLAVVLRVNPMIRRLEGADRLEAAHAQLTRESLERARVQEALHTLNRELERRVETRTLELAERNQELADFAFIGAHDLQEPLRKIQILGDRLLGGWRDRLDERGGDYLRRMGEAARRAQTLINAFLNYTRVARGEAHPERVDSARLATEVMADLKPVIQQTGARITLGVLPRVWADPDLLRLLLHQLLENALRFHRPDAPPLIHIDGGREALPEGAVYRLSVTDNGVGIPEDQREHIFTPFERLGAGAGDTGTGMGLAICRRIARVHQADLLVQDNPGGGSRFTLRLPLLPKVYP